MAFETRNRLLGVAAALFSLLACSSSSAGGGTSGGHGTGAGTTGSATGGSGSTGRAASSSGGSHGSTGSTESSTGGAASTSGGAGATAGGSGSSGSAGSTTGPSSSGGSSTGGASSSSGGSSGGSQGPYVQHVFVIIEENKASTDIYGSSSAPYLNSLMSTYTYASDYVDVVDPSEPNYIWLEAGDYDVTDSCGNCEFGTSAPVSQGSCTDDPPTCANPSCTPTSSNTSCTTQHLTALLDAAGVSWKAYAEGITASGSGLCPIANDSSNNFAVRHVPFVFFQDVSGNPPDATNAYCEQHVVDFSNFAGDLASGPASYVFITPNLIDDMHNGTVQDGDQWLQNTAGIQSLITYVTTAQNHAILLILWDEEDTPGALQPMVLVAPVSTLASPGQANATELTHSSTLKSIQEIFQVTPLLRQAGNSGVNDYASFFNPGYFP